MLLVSDFVKGTFNIQNVAANQRFENDKNGAITNEVGAVSSGY